jgi:hypothetical protein
MPRSSSVSPSVALTTADKLIDGRVVESTKMAYASSIKRIKRYYTVELGRDLTVPVLAEDIKGFFTWLLDVHFKDKPPPALPTIRAYKSALVDLYRQHKMKVDDSLDHELEAMLSGYKKQVASLKLDGKMPVFEGKYHLTFDGYRILSSGLLTSSPFGQGLFGWAFLVLQWNLIARCATVSSIMMEHVNWEGDALLITTPKQKADQEGTNTYARHLYANPIEPAICPVLALAVLIFTRIIKHDHTHRPAQPSAALSLSAPSSSVDAVADAPLPNFRVFDGTRNEARFSAALGRAILSLPPADRSRLGGERSQLGTHSIRKGASTYCACMVNGPSPVQIYLRAGWSLGVQDRYLFAGSGGDQLTGRVLAGLPFNNTSFTSLPPHFDAEGIRLIRWHAILPIYSQFPDTFKRAVPYLLASICYHETWLRSTLSSYHPLFATYLFSSGDIELLRSHLHGGRSSCTATGMSATGIPPHLILSHEMTDVAKQTALAKEEILNMYSGLPAEVVAELMKKFVINGAVPVTLADITTLLNQVVSQMRSEIRDVIPTAIAASPPAAVSLLDGGSNDARFLVWTWKGAMHPVPEDWCVPSTDMKATWNLWHFGHVQDKIRPLRHLKKIDLQTDNDIALWSKTKGVVAEIVELIVQAGEVRSAADVKGMLAEQSSAAFDRAIVQLMEKVREGSTRQRGRWMEMSVPTLYNRIKPLRDVRRTAKKAATQAVAKRKREERAAVGGRRLRQCRLVLQAVSSGVVAEAGGVV